VIPRTTQLAGLALLVGFPITNGSAQKVAVLGYLTNANADPKRIEDVRHALANLGYVEGKNIAIEVKGAKSNSDYAPLAAFVVEVRKAGEAAVSAGQRPGARGLITHLQHRRLTSRVSARREVKGDHACWF